MRVVQYQHETLLVTKEVSLDSEEAKEELAKRVEASEPTSGETDSSDPKQSATDSETAVSLTTATATAATTTTTTAKPAGVKTSLLAGPSGSASRPSGSSSALDQILNMGKPQTSTASQGKTFIDSLID